MRRPRQRTPLEWLGAANPAEAPRLWVNRCLPRTGQREAPRAQPFFQLLYVEGGRGHHVVDGQRAALQAGDLCWLRPGQVQDPAGLTGLRGWRVAFGTEAILPAASEGRFFFVAQSLALLPFAPLAEGARRTRVPRAERPRWVARFQTMAHELDHKLPGHGEAACAHLRLALIDLARLALPEGCEVPSARPLLCQVFAFIEARYRSPIGLREVAEAVGRSPAYLTDLVRRETGRTVLQWVIDRRLAEARRLLLQSEAPIGSIAGELGYLDPKHFAVQFRRAVGSPPHAWRTARQGRIGKKA